MWLCAGLPRACVRPDLTSFSYVEFPRIREKGVGDRGLGTARFFLRSTSGRCSGVVRAQTSASPAGGVSFRARFSSGAVVRNGLLGAPSAVAPAPPSAMEHDDERSLSLGTELSASVPPPSPLTGCYLLAVIGEPHTHEHKEIILQRLVKGQFLPPYFVYNHLRVRRRRVFNFVFFNSPVTPLLYDWRCYFFVIAAKHTFSFCFAQIKMWESFLIVFFIG